MLFQSLLCFFLFQSYSPLVVMLIFSLKSSVFMLPNKYSKYSKGFGCMLSEVF